MQATTHCFVAWLMSLNLIMRYFVMALIFHAALLLALASIKLAIAVPTCFFPPRPVIEAGEKTDPPRVDLPIRPPGETDLPPIGGGAPAILQPAARGDAPRAPVTVIRVIDETGLRRTPFIAHVNSTEIGPAAGALDLHGQALAFADTGGLMGRRFGVNKVGGGTGGPPGLPRATSETERAVLAALRWLKANQKPDGAWDCHGGPEAGTALATLAFLGHGETADSSEFGTTVAQALQFLTSRVLTNGSVNGSMYAQALVTLALAEGYAMTGVPALQSPLERAARVIIDAQNVQKDKALHRGGWRYSPNDPTSDLSVSGWQIMALKSAANAGVDVPSAAFERALAFVWALYGKPGFGYDAPATAPGMTAVGSLCAQFLGQGDDERVHAALRWLRDQKLEWKSINGWALYYAYYATQAMFQGGADFWPKWEGQMRSLLLTNQAADGHWPIPPNSSELQSLDQTPVYATSLGALMLETYYRYLPMYEVLKKKR